MAFGYPAEPQFWIKESQLAPERYAKLVFNALARMSLHKAIQFLASLDSTKTVERILTLSFPNLFKEHGISEISEIVREHLPQMGNDVWRTVLAFFRAEGCSLTRSASQFDFERVRKVLEQLLKATRESTSDMQDIVEEAEDLLQQVKTQQSAIGGTQPQ